MDWVEFKQVCARYRMPYDDEYEKIVDTIELCKLTYEEYRHWGVYASLPDSDCAERLGLHLYYVAELENMCLGKALPVEKTCDEYEWSHMLRSTEIIRKGRKQLMTLIELRAFCLGWVQSRYPLLYQSRLFDEAMKLQRITLVEKYKQMERL